jgi:hypothetical protein
LVRFCMGLVGLLYFRVPAANRLAGSTIEGRSISK